MNNSPKIVFSRTLKRADWINTRLVKDGMLGEVWKLKEQSGKDLTILGSGSIVAQLAQAGLIDSFHSSRYTLSKTVHFSGNLCSRTGTRNRFTEGRVAKVEPISNP